MEDRQSIVICATPRSGSTFIGQTLAQGDRLGNPEEWFQGTTIEERKRAYGIAPGIDLAGYIHALLERERGPNGIFSMKIMWDTLVPLLARLRSTNMENREEGNIELLESHIPNPRYILITRRNKLRQAISYEKALQSGIWEFRGEKHSYDNSDLLFDYLRIEHEEAWESLLRNVGRNVFKIEYESFLDQRREIVSDLEKYLELDLRIVAPESKQPLLLMGDSVNAEWEERYHKISKRSQCYEQMHDGGGLPKDSMRALIEVGTGPVTILEKAPFHLEVTVRNEGTETWYANGFRDGRLWIRLHGFWTRDGETVPLGDAGYANLEDDLEPGMTAHLNLRVITPEKHGEYQLNLILEQEGVSTFECGGTTKPIVPVTVELNDTSRAAVEYFGEAEPQLAGWRWLGWLGYYYEGYFPWIFHQVFGWLYCSGPGAREDSYWLWTKDMDWLWTSRKDHPLFLRAADKKWLRFLETSSPDVQFVDTATHSILKFKPSKGEKSTEIPAD